MLMLSRKPGESVVLRWQGVEVRVTYLQQEGRQSRVSLGFDGPREVQILRAELEEARRADADR